MDPLETLLKRLRDYGPAVAGQHWALLTAEAFLANLSPPLPHRFPGSVDQAETFCAEAGFDPTEGHAMHEQAETLWRQLLGPRWRQAS